MQNIAYCSSQLKQGTYLIWLKNRFYPMVSSRSKDSYIFDEEECKEAVRILQQAILDVKSGMVSDEDIAEYILGSC